jgi:signal peptidase I
VTLRLERVVWWARQGLLTGGAVLGAVCILAAIAAAAFGLRPLVFLSGSMSPAIETGALGIAHEVPASSLEPGDVVSVPTEGGERVTHRIVSVAMDGDEAELRLRGDANATADADTYRVAHADRVLFDVPLVGYVVGWMVGPVGLFLLGLYAAFLLSVILKQPTQRASAPDPDPDPTAGHVTATALTLVVLAAAVYAVMPVRVSPTLAAFTDPVAVSGTQLTAALPSPANPVCVKGNGQRVTLSWDVVTGVTYRVYDDGVATAPTAAGTYTTANRDFGQLWVVATRTFSGQQWTSADSTHFTYDRAVCRAA